MKETLLQKAKKTGKNSNRSESISKEEIELALAWVNGEVGIRQIHTALGLKSPTRVYTFLAFTLKEHLLKSKNK